jgi:hypothetical protein
MSIGVEPLTKDAATPNGSAPDDEYRARARKRVEELRGFYIHASLFAIANAALFVIDWVASPGSTWFYWPLLGWGVGFAAHAVVTFLDGPFGAAWEQRKTNELVAKYRRLSH